MAFQMQALLHQLVRYYVFATSLGNLQTSSLTECTLLSPDYAVRNSYNYNYYISSEIFGCSRSSLRKARTRLETNNPRPPQRSPGKMHQAPARPPVGYPLSSGFHLRRIPFRSPPSPFLFVIRFFGRIFFLEGRTAVFCWRVKIYQPRTSFLLSGIFPRHARQDRKGRWGYV